jgi:hypothetical protein
MRQKPSGIIFILFGTSKKHSKTTTKISSSFLNMLTSSGCRSQTDGHTHTQTYICTHTHIYIYTHTGISFSGVGMHVDNVYIYIYHFPLCSTNQYVCICTETQLLYLMVFIY